MIPNRRQVLAAMATLPVLGFDAARAEPGRVVIFAAASLKTALDAIMTAWHAETGRTVVASYAASSALARQLEQGAPAHLFISADADWMDYVSAKGLVRRETRVDLAGNQLVIIARTGRKVAIEIKPGLDLSQHLGGGRLALAHTTSVPAGKYAKAALEKLGAWAAVSGHLAQTENVRAALLLVSRGEAPLGIVYASDAQADANVEVVSTFPADSHPPIVYPAALTRLASADAEAFLRFLGSPESKALFAAHGFSGLQ